MSVLCHHLHVLMGDMVLIMTMIEENIREKEALLFGGRKLSYKGEQTLMWRRILVLTGLNCSSYYALKVKIF